MSTKKKYQIIEALKAAVEGHFGSWAQEVREMIHRLEENLHDDLVFASAAKDWERLKLQKEPRVIQKPDGRRVLQYF